MPLRQVTALFLLPAILIALLVAVSLQHLRHSIISRKDYFFFSASITASCIHNADNILRPVFYHTPLFIYESSFRLFPMDAGVVFWIAVAIVGVLAVIKKEITYIVLHG